MAPMRTKKTKEEKTDEKVIKPTFFSVRQNNSGGVFGGPAVNVIIDAPTKQVACDMASRHIDFCGDSGMYAEYDSCGCCPCCGHRWSEPYGEEPEKVEWILEMLNKYGMEYLGGVSVALIKPDGTMVVGDTEDKFAEIVEYISRGK